jgi:hypothetical protein
MKAQGLTISQEGLKSENHIPVLSPLVEAGILVCESVEQKPKEEPKAEEPKAEAPRRKKKRQQPSE